MADKKTSLIEDISKNTKEIAKETKTFGPKLPSKSESTEQTEYMVESVSEINDVLIGSFAHLIFGEANKRKYSDLAGLVGKSADDTIFGNIRDIAKMIGAKKGTNAHEFGTQIANGMTKSKDYFTKLESSIKNGIKTSFTDLEIIKQLNSVNSNLESVKDTSSNNSLDSLIKDNNDKLGEIYKILEERSKSDVLKEIDVRLKSTGDLKSLVNLLNQISKTKITEQTHKTLNEIVKLTDKDGELDKIIQNVSLLNQNADKVIKSTKGIEAIKNIIQLLQNSVSISPIDVIRFKSNMFWIHHFVIKGLMKTLNKMGKLQDTTKQDQEAITVACKNFIIIFDLIQKSAEFGFWKSLKIRFNLMNLRDVIRNDFADTLNAIIETLNSNSLAQLGQYAEKRLQALQSFIVFLNAIVNDEKFDVYKISERLESIQMLVENQLTNLMKSINDDLNVQKETTKFDSLQFNIESIRNLRDIMPTWLELLSMVYKTQLMLEFISKIAKASEEINKIPKITISKTQWTDLTDKYIEGLINVGELINSIDVKTYSESIKKNLIPYTKDIISLFDSIEKFNELNIDKEKLKEIGEYLKEFNKLPVDKLPKQANMLKLLDIENIINQFVKNFEGDPFLIDKHLDVLINNIEQIVIAFSRNGLVGQHLDTMVQITKDDISKLDKLVEYFDSLDKLAKKMAIVEKLTGNINKNPEDTGLVKLANALKTAVERFNDIQISQDKLDALNKGINALAKFVVTSAAIMLFGAIMMMVIPIANVFLFAVTLGTFVWGVMHVYRKLDKDVKLSMEGAKAFSLLLVVSAASLLFGGLIMQIVDPISLVKFVFFQTVFMFGLSYVYKRFLDESKMTMEGAAAFTILLGASAMILIAGSLFFKLINWEDAFKFIGSTALFVLSMILMFGLPRMIGKLLPGNPIGAAIASLDPFQESLKGVKDFAIVMFASAITVITGSLLFKAINWGDAFKFIGSTALFVLSMVLIFGLPRMIGKLLPGTFIGEAIASLDPFQESLKGVKDFAILIFATGITLALGAWISRNVPMKDLLGFATSLGLFMLMVMTPLLLMRGSIAIAQNTGKEFAKIIIVSASTMVIGGLLFTWFPSIKKGVLEFALIHGLYMLAISTSLKLLGRMNPEKLLKNAIALMLITVVSGAVLLTAGMIMRKNPSMTYNVPLFVSALFFYILGMTFVLKRLSKIQGNLIKGVIAIGLLSICTGIAAISLLKVGELSKQVSWVDLINGIAQLSTALLLLGGAYWGFGYLFFLDGGIGLGLASLALLAISGLSYLTSSVMIHINNNQQHYDVKSINKFKTAITAMGDLAKEMIDQFGSLTMMIRLPMASSAVVSLSFALSSIASAIEEYANLKVSIYRGTKVIGYRQLKSADFKSAAKNVKLIITTLGSAVIDTYDKNPEIFETKLIGTSKFAKVTKALGTLGPMLSSIARAVKQYANMQVGEDYQKNEAGFLEPTKYRQLNENDFKEAGKNVKSIIVTLGSAIIDTYDKKPEIFETNLFGTSKFAKVTKSLRTLSPLISSIARSVKTYADLKIADYGDVVKYDKDGKPIIQKYIPLGHTDFEKASESITEIISTLGGSIIDAYEAHPEYYESSTFGTSKFAKTVNANITLAKLISRIGKAVADMANLRVATDWFTEGENIGKAKEWRQLDKTDFSKAAANIMTIITTLGKPIEVIAADPEKMKLYDSASGFLGFGGTKSKFMKVVEGNMKLAGLISNIGKAVADMANLRVATDWFTEGENVGKAKEWKQLDKTDFTKAAANIMEIITTLGKPIEKIAKNPEKMKLYEDTSGFLGIGAKKSPFTKVINGNLKLAELISKIGAAVKDYAALKMPTGYDKDGKPTGYKSMGEKEFKDAANAVKAIITTLANSVMESYNEHKDWFDDGEDSIFGQACAAIGSMGNMISQIAGGISAYAQLKIPNWAAGVNEDGTPKQYAELNKDTFEKASSAISLIVSNIGDTVIKTYKEHKEWFDDGEDSEFVIACTAIGHMGEMIGAIADGVRSYAELKIPTEYDAQGNAIKFRELGKQDFENAANHISTIISVIGKTITEQFDAHQEWFAVKSEGESTTFQRVIEGCTAMGEMIGAIAQGVQMFAEAKMPIGFDKDGKPTGFTQLNDTTYTAAAKSIAKVIECIGGAIDKTFYAHKDWFEATPLKTSGFFGLLTSEKPNPSDPPFMKAVKGVGMIGGVIGSVAEGVQMFASMKMPTGFDSTGKPTGFEKLDPKMYGLAATNVGKVITVLGKAINDAYLNNIKLFQNPNLTKIMSSFAQMGRILSSISMGIQSYVRLSVPDEIDPATGKGNNYRKIKPKDFINAGKNISKVLLCIGTAIEEVANGEIFKRWNSSKSIDSIIKMYSGITPVIGNLAKVIKQYSSLKIPIRFDEKGNPTEFTKMSPGHITKAGNTIGMVLKAIGNAIVDTVSGNEKLFGDPQGWLGRANPDPKASPAYRAAIAISEMTKPISAMAEILAYYSMGKFPYTVGTDKDGKPIIKLMENKISVKDVQRNIENVLRSIAFPLYNVMEDSRYKDTIFKQEGDKTLGALRAEQLTVMVNKITTITEEIKKLDELTLTDCTEKLVTIKDLLTTVMNETAAIAKLISDPIPGLSQTDNSSANQNMNIEYLAEKLNTFNKTVKQLVDVMDYSDETGIEGYNIIMTGLDGIISKIAVLPKEDNLKKNVTQLEKYVNTVNRVDLSKIIALNNLGSTLNILATKMGNLDKLTETLATQIATVLDRLVKELKHAEETIKKADVLQKRRHELINKATKEVKSIMDQKMLVEIKQVQDEIGIDGGSSSSSSSQSGSSQSTQHMGGGSDGGSQITPANDEHGTKDPKDKKVTLATTSKSETQQRRGNSSGGNSVGSGISEDNIYNAIMRALRNSKYST